MYYVVYLTLAVIGFIILVAVARALRLKLASQREKEASDGTQLGIAAALHEQYPVDNDMTAFADLLEVTSADTPIFERILSVRMREIVSAADSLAHDDLVQSAIRLGNNQEVAESYATHILAELYPPAPNAPPMPNMGGLDSKVPYSGPNLVAAEDLAAEMKTIQHFGQDNIVDMKRRAVRDQDARADDRIDFLLKSSITPGCSVEVLVARLMHAQIAQVLDPEQPLPRQEWLPATVVYVTPTAIGVAFSDGERLAVPRTSLGWRLPR